MLTEIEKVGRLPCFCISFLPGGGIKGEECAVPFLSINGEGGTVIQVLYVGIGQNHLPDGGGKFNFFFQDAEADECVHFPAEVRGIAGKAMEKLEAFIKIRQYIM